MTSRLCIWLSSHITSKEASHQLTLHSGSAVKGGCGARPPAFLCWDLWSHDHRTRRLCRSPAHVGALRTAAPRPQPHQSCAVDAQISPPPLSLGLTSAIVRMITGTAQSDRLIFHLCSWVWLSPRPCTCGTGWDYRPKEAHGGTSEGQEGTVPRLKKSSFSPFSKQSEHCWVKNWNYIAKWEISEQWSKRAHV